MTISIILEQARSYCYFVVNCHSFCFCPATNKKINKSTLLNVALFRQTQCQYRSLKPVDVFLSYRYWNTDSFSRTTLAGPGRLGLRLSFPEPYEASNLKISFSTAKTLQNSEIYKEIDTTTLKCQDKIHTSAFGSLTAAMEEDTNQTS